MCFGDLNNRVVVGADEICMLVGLGIGVLDHRLPEGTEVAGKHRVA